MIEPVSTIKAGSTLPQQSVTKVHLEELFDQHMQAPIKPMGEALLEGIQDLRENLNQQSREIQEKFETTPNISFTELIKVQSELSRLVLVEETLAKTVNKCTQNIDTLLKSQ